MFNAVLDETGAVLAANLPDSYIRKALTADPPEIRPTAVLHVYRLQPADMRVLSPVEKRRRHLQRTGRT